MLGFKYFVPKNLSGIFLFQVPLISNVGTSGLGAGDAGLPPPIVQTKQSLKKDALWRKMQERFVKVVSSDPGEVVIEDDDVE